MVRGACALQGATLARVLAIASEMLKGVGTVELSPWQFAPSRQTQTVGC